jgi:YfiH family protein
MMLPGMTPRMPVACEREGGLAVDVVWDEPVSAELAVEVFTLAPGVRAAFTGRRGGVSRAPYDTLNLGAGSGDAVGDVTHNRKLVAAACGLAPDHMIWMRQVHGADVGHVPGPQASDELPPARDASFTSAPGLALGVLSADCPGVLVADPEARIAGAAHAGRQGMAGGVVPALVRAMTERGADPGRMHAVIGPGICGGCYEVPAAMRDEVGAAVPGAACLTRAGTPGLDLAAGIAGQLAGVGVRWVRTDGRCTAEDPGLYSYRRDGRTGRFAGLVWLTP